METDVLELPEVYVSPVELLERHLDQIQQGSKERQRIFLLTRDDDQLKNIEEDLKFFKNQDLADYWQTMITASGLSKKPRIIPGK